MLVFYSPLATIIPAPSALKFRVFKLTCHNPYRRKDWSGRNVILSTTPAFGINCAYLHSYWRIKHFSPHNYHIILCVCKLSVLCQMHTALSFPSSPLPRSRQMWGTKEKPSHFFTRLPHHRDNLRERKTLHLPPFFNDVDDMAHYLGSVSCRRKYTHNNETYKNIILPHNWAYFVLNCLLLRAGVVAALPSCNRIYSVFTCVIVHSAPSDSRATVYCLYCMPSMWTTKRMKEP